MRGLPAGHTHSKRSENHEAAVALHFMYFTTSGVYTRLLRVTPAMEAGLAHACLDD